MHISPYKISTITATGGVCAHVDLDVLFANIIVESPTHFPDSHAQYEFKYIEYGRKNEETLTKGINEKKKVRRRKEVKKRFDNQATLILYITDNMTDSVGFLPNKDRFSSKANMKVFKNGNVQITGLKSINAGRYVVDALILELKRIATLDPTVVSCVDDLKSINYCIRLINSDFTTGIDINRDKIYRILQHEYNVFASFEPCIYPAVKIQYYWRHGAPIHGCCNCPIPCFTREPKKSIEPDYSRCKKITIAVFQSGCIIITGAQSYEQVDDAYEFIVQTLKAEVDRVKKMPNLCAPKTTVVV